MKQGWEAVPHSVAHAVAAGALALVSASVLAQASSAPPPLPAAAAGAAAQKPGAPRSSIQLTPAERQAIDAAQSAREKPSVEQALVPGPEDMKPRAADDPATTRIEQTHVSNRVSEVIVTPAGQSRSYVMTNREGQQPFGTTQMGSGGLSVPMFFRFEFGRSPPASSTSTTPPPPAPSPSR